MESLENRKKEHRVPMWVSSLTGGTKLAGTIRE